MSLSSRSLIDRYLFFQLFWPLVWVTSILLGITVFSQVIGFFDLLLDPRQGLWMFLKILVFTLPQMLALVFPIAVFIAALIGCNRLHTEQEIVVCQATGFSPWQIASPAFRLASLGFLMILAINLWIQPFSMRLLREELFRVRTDIITSLIHEGEFTSSGHGQSLTLYAQSVSSGGLLKNIFVYQDGKGGESTSYIADRGLITMEGDQPMMVLQKGSRQKLKPDGVLEYVRFSEYSFDVSDYVKTTEKAYYKASDRYIHELFYPDFSDYWDKKNQKAYVAEAHYRLSSPLYIFSFMALALHAILGGIFHRRGYGKRIWIVVGISLALRLSGFIIQSLSAVVPVANVMQYALPLVPLIFVLRHLLWPQSLQKNLITEISLPDRASFQGAAS